MKVTFDNKHRVALEFGFVITTKGILILLK